MSVNVLLFAAARDAVGKSKVAVELPEGCTVAMLRELLSVQYLALAPVLANSQIAVNQEWASDDVAIAVNDEVAVIPPVSGGAC